jgi:ADP-ribosyl-[dinitrogen reductase] hydrolase
MDISTDEKLEFYLKSLKKEQLLYLAKCCLSLEKEEKVYEIYLKTFSYEKLKKISENCFKIIENDKISGTIVGHSLGDALGSPHEFYPHGFYTGKLESPIIKYSRCYGKQISSIGQISDDTEMAIILLRLLGNGVYTKEKAVIEYMTWANNRFDKLKGNMPFMGANTRALFIIGANSKPSMKLYDNRFKKQFPNSLSMENAQSNGSLMRAYPLAFINDKKILKIDSEITNPSKLVINAIEIYILSINLALKGASKQQIKKEIKSEIKNEILMIAYKQACENKFRNVTINRGHIVHAIYCTFWSLFNFDDYKSGIDAIICLGPSKNEKGKICVKGNWKKSEVILGDTDTNAAIAGALLGAFYGLEHILKSSSDNVKIMTECNTKKGDIKRPEIYEMNKKNLNELIVLATKIFK